MIEQGSWSVYQYIYKYSNEDKEFEEKKQNILNQYS